MKKLLQLPKGEFSSIVRAALIALGAYFVLFAMISAAITPEQYDLQVGLPAPADIFASKNVVDTVTTEQLREEAANAVDVSYKSVDPTVTAEVLAHLEEQFSLLVELASAEEAGNTDGLLVNLTPAQLEKMMAVQRETLEGIFSHTIDLVRDALNATLPEGQESAMVARIERDLNAENYDSTLVSVAVDVVEACIRPNMLIDTEITEANRQKARDSVEDQVRVKDEVIVSKGEIVTPAQFAMLSSLGLIADGSFDLQLILGVALLVLIMFASLGLYMYRYEHDIWRKPQSLLLLGLIMILVLGISLIVRDLNPYMMPISLGVLLVAVLIRPHLALFVNFVLSILASFLATASSGFFTMTMFSIMIMSAVSGPIVVLVMRRRQQRTVALLCGVLVGLANLLTTLAVGMVYNADTDAVLPAALWAATSGPISAVLCIGIQPMLEWMFNLTTSAKLLELSNPNQPLLRRLMLEAPGSYHHSIIVANLAEAAAEAVGANGLLARVGAYYHDIGKLKRPGYFKENQMGDNPHDRTDPRVSAAILTAHTRDGYQMGLKARLPEPVLDIIRQHHGDTPMVFFYDKAVKLYKEDVDISQFRYEGPRPRSKEAAVVMLADTIEAAARSLPNPDPEKLDTLIHKLVRNKMLDGQLDESDLTFADLERICKAFATVLSGVFHERIEYPEISIPPRKETEHLEAASAEALSSPATAPEAETEAEEGDNGD